MVVLAEEEILFEKIIPKDGIPGESKNIAKLPEREAKGAIQTKAASDYSGEKLGEFQKRMEKLEKRLEGLGNIDNLQNKVDKFERVLQTKIEKFEKTKNFGEFLEEFYEKLDDIEEAKKQVFIFSSRTKSIYNEMEEKLDGLDTLLDKMHRFDEIFKLAKRLERFEADMKNGTEGSFAGERLPHENIEQIKTSVLEQRFFSLISILSLVKETKLKMNLADELNKTIDEMKIKDLWDIDKKLLLEEILKEQKLELNQLYL